jgi:hypothetical protein
MHAAVASASIVEARNQRTIGKAGIDQVQATKDKKMNQGLKTSYASNSRRTSKALAQPVKWKSGKECGQSLYSTSPSHKAKLRAKSVSHAPGDHKAAFEAMKTLQQELRSGTEEDAQFDTRMRMKEKERTVQTNMDKFKPSVMKDIERHDHVEHDRLDQMHAAPVHLAHRRRSSAGVGLQPLQASGGGQVKVSVGGIRGSAKIHNSHAHVSRPKKNDKFYQQKCVVM